MTKSLFAAGCLWVLAVASCLGGGRSAPAGNDPSAVVPATGHIGTIQVGVTTMEQLERWFGKGRAFIGGHPRGAREWVLQKAGWYIYADGFDYSRAGRVLDRFEISTTRIDVGASDDTERKARRASLARTKLGFVAGVAPGMERSRVLALLNQAGIKPAAKGKVVSWEEKGHTPNLNGSFSTWTARLTFRHDKLENICIECN